MLQYATREDIERLSSQLDEIKKTLAQIKNYEAQSKQELPDEDRWLKTHEACLILKIDRQALYRLVRTGRLAKHKTGGEIGGNRYDRIEIRQLLENSFGALKKTG